MLRWVGLRRRILGDGGESGNAATGGMSPNPGQPGQTVTVTPGGGLGGAGFGTGTGTVVIGGVAATVSSWTASLITFVVPVQTTYPILLPLVVTTTTGETAGTDYTTVYPAITSLSQTTGQPGASLTLTGSYFGASAGTVTIAGLAATVTAWSATSVTVTVPSTGGGSGTYPDAGSVILTTSYGNAATAAQTYTITAPNPAIVHVQQPLATNVSSGDYGSDVYLIGTLFGTLQGTGGVKIHGHAATIVSWSDTQIRLTVPAEASYPDASTIVLTTGGGLTSAPFAFTTLFPAITSMSVTTGQPGSSLTLTGSDFKASQGAGSVTIAGLAAAVTAWSDTSVTVTVPSAGGTSSSYPDTGAVLLINNSGSPASGPSNFTITVPNPVISSLSAASGVPGASLTLTGTFFGASQGAGGVTIDGTVAAVTSWAETSVTVTVPARGSYPDTGNGVLTTNGALTSNGMAYTTNAAPVISSLSAASGLHGSSLTITGTHFYASQGGGGVTVAGVTAAVTSWADTSIVVTVPAQSSYPTSGNVVVTNSAALASAGTSFRTDDTPAISHIQQPLSTNVIQAVTGTDVYLVGTGFYASQGGGGVTVHGVAATVVSWADTQVRITLPAQSAYPDTGNVVLTNSSGIVSSGVSFETDTAHTYANKGAGFTAASSSRLSATHNALLRPAAGGFSLAFWAKVTGNVDGYTVIGKGQVGQMEYDVDQNSSKFRFTTSSDGTSGNQVHVFSSTTLTPGTWYFVTALYDGATTIKISVNNGAFQTATVTGVWTGGTNELDLGRFGSFNGLYLDGAVDSVGIWQKALSGAEITALYNGGVGMAYYDLSGSLLTSLSAWYDLDEASGNRLDATANHFDFAPFSVAQVTGVR